MALLVLWVAARGEPAETGDVAGVQIRDSADIRIVEYTGAPSVPTLTLAEDPLYTHGSDADH